MQHTATHRQHTATHCNILQCTHSYVIANLSDSSLSFVDSWDEFLTRGLVSRGLVCDSSLTQGLVFVVAHEQLLRPQCVTQCVSVWLESHTRRYWGHSVWLSVSAVCQRYWLESHSKNSILTRVTRSLVCDSSHTRGLVLVVAHEQLLRPQCVTQCVSSVSAILTRVTFKEFDIDSSHIQRSLSCQYRQCRWILWMWLEACHTNESCHR